MVIRSQDTSRIIVSANGATSFVGEDATRLFAATVLWSSLKLYARAKILPTRGVSATDMLKMATTYTGQKYRRGQHAKAAEDVKLWMDAMKAALPVVEVR